MRKKMTVSILSVLLVFVLAACSSSGTTDSTSATNNVSDTTQKPADVAASAPAGKKTKLTYWTTDRHDAEYIKGLIAKYNTTNKDNVEIELTVMADNYNQAVDVAFASDQAPDILRVNGLDQYKKGYFAVLNDLMTPEMKTKFQDLLIEDNNIKDGKIFSLPNYGQTWRLIYNVELFEKAGITSPPTTLKEMVEDAKKITEVGKAVNAYGFAGNYKSGGAFGRAASPIATLSYGRDKYDIKTGQFDFSIDKEVALALRQIKVDGSMLPGVESLDMDPLRAQFAEGKIGMYINHSGEPGVYKDQFPAKIKWASAQVPTVDGTIKGATRVIAGQWLGISSKTKYQKEAWNFLQFMYGDDTLTDYYEKGFGISVVPSINTKAKQPTMPGIEGFITTKYDAIYPADPPVEGKLEGLQGDNEFSKFVMTGGDIDKIIADLNTRYNAALAKAKAAGEVTAVADPSFDAMKLQGTVGK